MLFELTLAALNYPIHHNQFMLHKVQGFFVYLTTQFKIALICTYKANSLVL